MMEHDAPVVRTFVCSRECHVCHMWFPTKNGRDRHEQHVHGIDHGFDSKNRKVR